MKWKIKLSGDKKYLGDLKNILDMLNFNLKIYKEEENYYLEGSIFENINDEKEILEITKNFLIYIFNLPHFKSKRNIEAPRVKNIIETVVTEEGVRIRTYDLEEGGYSEDLITKDGKTNHILNVHNLSVKQTIEEVNIYNPRKIDCNQFKTIEQISILIQDNKYNEELINNFLSECLIPSLENLLKFSVTSNESEGEKRKGKIQSFLSDLELLNTETNFETLKWIILYKIYELIENGLKDINIELEKINWINKNKMKIFKCTAKIYRHAEPGDCKDLINKSGKMELSDAEEVISTLLSKYIEYKVKDQVGRL